MTNKSSKFTFSPRNLSLLEIILIEMVFYSALWLWNDYIATYMSVVLPSIIAAILVISVVAEMIEPSKISRKYFWVMGLSVVIPFFVGLIFIAILGGELSWMQGF